MSLFGSIGDILTGGVGSLIGGVVSGVGSLLGGEQANTTNEQIASAATASNVSQADTTYQRSVQDLEAAGLNPVLAVSSGFNDPVGQAQMATVTNALGAAANSGVTNFSSLQGSRQVDPQIAQIDAQTQNLQSQAKLNTAMIAKTAADTVASLASARAGNAAAAKTESGSLLADTFGTDNSKTMNSALSSGFSNVLSLLHNITNNTAASGAVGNAVSNFTNPINSFLDRMAGQ